MGKVPVNKVGEKAAITNLKATNLPKMDFFQNVFSQEADEHGKSAKPERAN